jgi:hypothetical protein
MIGKVQLARFRTQARWYGCPVRRLARIVAATAAAFAVACEPAAPALPILTDPAEVVMAGIRSTAALHAVHARIEFDFNMPGGGGMNGEKIEIDADLDTRSFAGRTVSSSGDGSEYTTEFIWVGGRQLTRTPPNERWTSLPNFGPGQGLPFPTNDELVTTISTLVAGDGMDIRLAEPAACGDSTCYHAIADLDADATWQLAAPLIVGGPATGPPPDGLTLAPITIDLYIDQATRALVAANTTFVIQGSALRLALVLTNHDVAVRIVAPPPAMVDELDLNNVGGGAAPPPAAVESP